MSEAVWTKRKKGSGTIHVLDGCEHAVVDSRGFGVHPGIKWNGQRYDTVTDAKAAAEASLNR